MRVFIVDISLIFSQGRCLTSKIDCPIKYLIIGTDILIIGTDM